VPIYDSISLAYQPELTEDLPVHTGICCDGPVCKDKNPATYIRGIRFKCTICEDVDFCAGCEANPKNSHNKTHPVIKFKTPVRQVSVTTTGEHSNGQKMPAMGDKPPVSNGLQNNVQAIIAMRSGVVPHEPINPQAIPAQKVKAVKSEASGESTDLRAVFVSDSVQDGTILPANTTFEQTWVLRNEGTVAWPAGCSVKFVGGDYMGQVDSSRPAAISEIVSASESTVSYEPIAPGQTFSFTVLLRTPSRPGKVISYWRLTTKDGHKFGHRLWCDVSVRGSGIDETTVSKSKKERKSEDGEARAFVFPKAETGSVRTQVEPQQAQPTLRTQVEPKDDDDSGASTDGFLTDEEYDILDASDEEFFNDQLKK
jgi:next-to-BRCA1 protein 1